MISTTSFLCIIHWFYFLWVPSGLQHTSLTYHILPASTVTSFFIHRMNLETDFFHFPSDLLCYFYHAFHFFVCFEPYNTLGFFGFEQFSSKETKMRKKCLLYLSTYLQSLSLFIPFFRFRFPSLIFLLTEKLSLRGLIIQTCWKLLFKFWLN